MSFLLHFSASLMQLPGTFRFYVSIEALTVPPK